MIYYVYTLSYDGIVFYIGCTKHPLKRYKQHCAGNDVATHGIILERAMNKELPVLNLVHHSFDKEDCMNRERFLIHLHSDLNHNLCNIDYNKTDNIIGRKDRNVMYNKPTFNFDFTTVTKFIDTYNKHIIV